MQDGSRMVASMERRNLLAAASVVVAAILTAIGTFSGGDEDFATWLIVVAVFLVGAAVVFWLVVPRVERFGRGALILAILGAIALAIFWTGLPPVFAGGAALLALAARERGTETGMATAALVIAGLTVVAATVAAFVG